MSVAKSFEDIQREICSIPGNEPVLEELMKVLEAGDALGLVGAGASAGLWPLWNEFLGGFIGYSLKHGKIHQAEADFFLEQASQIPLEIAQQLRNKIGDRLYFEYLQETFRDQESPQTVGAYTLTHKALLQLPIHNYITLNYDAGLTNARAAIYPKATTSYFFWDQDEARRIIEKNYKRLVLHAHGRHDRADSIILTLNDYRRAYDHHAFVRLLNEIFTYQTLIMVGFGMTDPYIKQLFNNISKDYQKDLRHIALVGLDDDKLPVAHLLREQVEMVYGARILFYPTKNHHQALTDWLTVLADKFTATATAEATKPLHTAPPQIKTNLPDRYVHQPTNDLNYQGRAQDLATLNRWANDPATRTIAITGIGGQGKTALTGRWLMQERSPELKQIPVFYWSFYEDLDVGKFLKEVVEFCLPILRVYSLEIEPMSFILSVVRQVRLLLVLDGLEVLQEEASSPAHGRINHPMLEQFLQQWLRYPHQGLMILTSRFRFPQLERYSGVGFHHLDLIRLSTEDGVALLEILKIFGDKELLETYVDKLSGHPLALRVLASTVKRCCYGDLAQFKGDSIMTAAGEDDRISQKLQHLLGFYEKQLKNGQKELLGIISLFKRPVEIKSFVILLSTMKSLRKTPLAKATASDIEKQLDLLVDDFLIEKTPEGITTHPVIRDHFRDANQIAGSRREIADFLKARPGANRPINIEEVSDLVETVQLLCEEGEVKAADDIRKSRLTEGGFGFDVFRDLPAVVEGLECYLAFVKDEEVRLKTEKILGIRNLAFYYSGVALCNDYLGNLTQSLEWRYKSLKISLQQEYKADQAFNLHEISYIETTMGSIHQALQTISHALNLAHEIKESRELATDFADKAYYMFLLGNIHQAYQSFKIALLYKQTQNSFLKHLNSIWGNYQVEFLIRIKALQQFETVNKWNIQSCKDYHWNDCLAFCHLLQGWSEIYRDQLFSAEKSLLQAEPVLRPSGMVESICRLDWVWALLAEAKGEYLKGLQRVNDSLFVCADKGFRLLQADHLTLRGRLYIQQYQKENQQDHDVLEKAGDDGHGALKIAEQTGYVWAKVEALELLAAYHQIRAGRPGLKAGDEKEQVRRYAEEAATLKKGLALTEAQMKELEEEARKEFERQTAGWE